MAGARVSQWIAADPGAVYDAFIEPARLTAFWLAAADGPLAVGNPGRWEFMVPGAAATTTATRLDRPTAIGWDWDDGSRVAIALEPHDGGTAVTLTNDALPDEDAARNATEGFALVLADLKTLLETGRSAGIVAGKARLIAARG